MTEKIMTLHPEGKNGVNIDRDKYDIMHSTILYLLQEHAPIGFTPLMEMVKGELEGKFEGSVSWFFTTVKLDMEARGVVGRKTEKGRQLVTLTGAQ
jgi:hypothetical protein